ncbi:DUF262 domain-containing protein [Collinsella sp. AF02-46-1]|uniref:DUF262 domain-containing protein n=2 Tax=Collinsella TaxID=102106 RepID=UPI000E498979|nr:DUF262 domain-containing protein [Collinsella sp. AF05-9]RGW94417.1 DUF262 domain-containing protein [Collinsella sp. AF05-9]RGW95666.1 DUF262 domain-containing protein [Collinsella sp. AF05-8-2]RGX53123.1 DUF262 domain-containing protein [Collinsella sp. AF02-46-1]
MMINSVEDPTVANILSTDMLKIYDIPRYQREYTWNQRDWANLYDDITQNDAGYFLGSFIVVNGTVNSKMDTIHYEVIDGQQRLTTLSLLLAALYTRIMEHKDSIDDDMMLDDIRPLRNRLILKSDKSITRVIPQVQNHNLEDYRWILKEHIGLDTVIQKPKFLGLRKMSKAFNYFYDRLGEDVEGRDGIECVRCLLDICRLVCSAVVVQITVDSHADAYTLFASLNNRGVPLSAVDLIKNMLLGKVAGVDDGQLNYYFERWQEVLHNLGDDYKTQERFFRQNYDAFRREVNKPFIGESGSQLPLGSVATRSNLLKIYEKRMESDDGALKVLDELTENSALYSRIIGLDQESPDSELSHQLLELSRAQGVASYLLLLFLFKKQSQLELKDETLALLVKLLVCFFVRRNLTDTPPTRDLERLFISICESLESEGLKGIAAAEYIKKRLVDVSASDAFFKERLEGPIYDVNPDMTRYILTVIASPSVTKEMKPLWERYASGNYVWTIEHIFPQGKNIPDEWVKMVADGDMSKAIEVQEKQVHTLGNLTITGYNSKLSNMPFVTKRDRKDVNGANVGYRNGLNLNDELVNTDTWTSEQIQERTDKLVGLTLKAFDFDEIEF